MSQQQRQNDTTADACTAGQLLVDCLIHHGSELGFTVPCESFLGVLDALYDREDDFKLVVCRQEGGAAFMAEAYGKLTGRPGIAFVTRGPGATNASIGVLTAHLDATPMILFVGQITRSTEGRAAFQGIDLQSMFGGMAKLVIDVQDAKRIPELLSRAYYTACSGRPGPVVIGLPDDMQYDSVAVPLGEPYQDVQTYPSPTALAELRTHLSSAKKPLVLVGGSRWSQQACDRFRQFIDNYQLPVAAFFRRQDLFDNHHPSYVGSKAPGVNPKLEAMIREADVLLVVGGELSEFMTSGYKTLEVPRPQTTLIHVAPGPEELGRTYQPTLAIACDMESFAHAASELEPLTDDVAWETWRTEGRSSYEAFIQPKVLSETHADLAVVMSWLNTTLPDDAVMCIGAGNYTHWVLRYYEHRRFGTQLATQCAVMGYSVPAAVTASLLHPERIVVAFAGDGCFLMNGQEIATAVRYQTNIKFVVVNNNMYGSIRMHQELHFPERPIACDLTNPDFAKLGEAYGIPSAIAESNEAFQRIFEEFAKTKGPALIELRTDPEVSNPNATIADLRQRAKS
jgi:acetolactate synthase-1/2/3 large subunit